MKIPYSENVENEVLGMFMINFEKYSHIFPKLNIEDFYLNDNKKIFNAITKLKQNKKLVTAVTVFEYDSSLDLERLLSLTDTYDAEHILEHYISILKEKSNSRRIIELCSNAIVNMSNDKVEDIKDYTFKLASSLESCVIDNHETMTRLSDVVAQNIEETQLRAHQTFKNDIKTYDCIDRLTHGIDKTALVILAARPSVGKTAFAMNLAMKVASSENKSNVAFFSLEMSANQIAYRVMSNLARVEHNQFKNGSIAQNNPQKLQGLHEMSEKFNIHIDSSYVTKVSDIKEKCVKMKREQNLDLIIIDYLQLMAGSQKNMTKLAEVSEISRDLKNLALELNVPIIALSQLSRDIEKREDKTPRMSDLRDSGSLEQDADIVMLMSRDDYQKDVAGKPSVVKINLAKVRNGNTGIAEFLFFKDHTLFTEFSQKKDVRT